MILALNSQQVFTVVVLGLAIIFNLYSAMMVFNRNPRYNGNRFTSLAYLNLAIALTLCVFNVLMFDEVTVAIFCSIAIFFGMLTFHFLFLAVMCISEGDKSLHSYRIIIVVMNFLIGSSLILLFLLPVFPFDWVLPGSNQLIRLNDLYFLLAGVSLSVTLIPICYYYMKIWRGLPPDSSIKQASALIMLGTALIGLSYLLLLTPQIFKSILMLNLLVLCVNFGSIGVLAASLIINSGYRIGKTKKRSISSIVSG